MCVCVCVCVCVCGIKWCLAIGLLSKLHTESLLFRSLLPVFPVLSPLFFSPPLCFSQRSPWSKNESETAVKIILAQCLLIYSRCDASDFFVFHDKSPLARKSPQSLQSCFNLAPFECCRVTHMQWILCVPPKTVCQAREKRRTVQTPSCHPSEFQSWIFSMPYTPLILLSSPLSLFCFYSPSKGKHKYFNLSLSFPVFPFLILLHLSFSLHVILGWSSARGLRPHCSSHHPSHRLKEKCSLAYKLRDLAARKHEMMSSLVRCVDVPGHETNSMPFCGYMW